MTSEVLGYRSAGIGDVQELHLGSGIPESAAGSAAANCLCGRHGRVLRAVLGQNLPETVAQVWGLRNIQPLARKRTHRNSYHPLESPPNKIDRIAIYNYISLSYI